MGALLLSTVFIKNRQNLFFFETSDDKKSYAKTKEKILKNLEKFEKIAKEKDIPIKIKVALTDSISD